MPVISAGTLPTGNLKGADHGATISVILDQSGPGQGPRLHKHPYDETWVVIEGRLTFQSGEERLPAGPERPLDDVLGHGERAAGHLNVERGAGSEA